MQEWRARDPVTRFQAFLNEAGWWDPEQEKGLRVAMRKEVGISPHVTFGVHISPSMTGEALSPCIKHECASHLMRFGVLTGMQMKCA